jgi:hypothetical protein
VVLTLMRLRGISRGTKSFSVTPIFVILNLFQHDKQRFCVVLKHVRDDERMVHSEPSASHFLHRSFRRNPQKC